MDRDTIEHKNWFAKALKESDYDCISLSCKSGITIRRIKAVRDGKSKFSPVGEKNICKILGIAPPKYASTGKIFECNRNGCKLKNG